MPCCRENLRAFATLGRGRFRGGLFGRSFRRCLLHCGFRRLGRGRNLLCRSLFGRSFLGRSRRGRNAHRRRKQLGELGGGHDDAYFFFLFIVIEPVFKLIRVLIRLGFKLIVCVCVQFVLVLHSYASRALIATNSDRREPLSIILARGADYSNSMQRDANERKYELSFLSVLRAYMRA
jgi:hypothetical protein